MSIKYDVVTIRLNEYRTITRDCPPWETPVLQAMHEGDLTVIGDKVVDMDPPIPSEEFRRLADRYGPKDSDTPYVAQVYGNFGPGIKQIENVIRQSLTLEPETDGPAPLLKERLDKQRPSNPFAADIARLQAEATAGAKEEPVAAGGVPVSELGLDEEEADFSDLLDEAQTA